EAVGVEAHAATATRRAAGAAGRADPPLEVSVVERVRALGDVVGAVRALGRRLLRRLGCGRGERGDHRGNDDGHERGHGTARRSMPTETRTVSARTGWLS